MQVIFLHLSIASMCTLLNKTVSNIYHIIYIDKLSFFAFLIEKETCQFWALIEALWTDQIYIFYGLPKNCHICNSSNISLLYEYAKNRHYYRVIASNEDISAKKMIFFFFFLEKNDFLTFLIGWKWFFFFFYFPYAYFTYIFVVAMFLIHIFVKISPFKISIFHIDLPWQFSFYFKYWLGWPTKMWNKPKIQLIIKNIYHIWHNWVIFWTIFDLRNCAPPNALWGWGAPRVTSGCLT